MSDVALAPGRGVDVVKETEKVANAVPDWNAVRRWSRELSVRSDGSASVRTPRTGMEGMDTQGHKRASVEVYEDEE